MDSSGQISVTARSLDTQGYGICPTPQGEIRVANLLPGESAQVRVLHESCHTPTAWAEIITRTSKPAAMRVQPLCPAFGNCGGCIWQHLDYPAQLKRKQLRLRDALEDKLDQYPEIPAVTPSPTRCGFRNRGNYVVGSTKTGGIVLGAYAPRSHKIVDTAGCQVVHPNIELARHRAQAALSALHLPVYQEQTQTGQLRYVLCRSNQQGDVLVTLVTTSATSRSQLIPIAKTLHSPPIRGVSWMRNDTTTGSLYTANSEPLAGAPTISEQVFGTLIELGPSTFFQVHYSQAMALYAKLLACTEAGPDTRAIDIYCGVGSISFALASVGARVVGIDRNAVSVTAARCAANVAGLETRVQFHSEDAANFHRFANTANLAIVNPPRRGLAKTTLSRLTDLAIPMIAYVSCNPTSLAHDLCRLTLSGYRITALHPFDFMPGTPQLETLAILTRH